MTGWDGGSVDRGIELLQSQLAELARYGELLEGQADLVHLDDPGALEPFLEETDRLAASIEERHGHLSQLRGMVDRGHASEARLVEFRRLWQDMNMEMARLRAGIAHFTRLATARQAAIASQLDELRAGERRRRYPSGETPRPTMVDTVG